MVPTPMRVLVCSRGDAQVSHQGPSESFSLGHVVSREVDGGNGNKKHKSFQVLTASLEREEWKLTRVASPNPRLSKCAYHSSITLLRSSRRFWQYLRPIGGGQLLLEVSHSHHAEPRPPGYARGGG